MVERESDVNEKTIDTTRGIIVSQKRLVSIKIARAKIDSFNKSLKIDEDGQASTKAVV